MSSALRPDILKTMVPVKDRAWYGFEWPDDAWYFRRGADAKREIEAFRRKVRAWAIDDFFFFCEHILREDRHPHLHVGLHDELCHILQCGGDCLNLLPRGHLKSTIGAQAYSLWRVAQNPNIRIVIFSDTKEVAGTFLIPIQQHILRNKRLRWLFPDLRPARKPNGKAEKWSTTKIFVRRDTYAKEATITVGSVGQPLTGLHCDLIIFDDVVTRRTARTEEKLVNVEEWHQDVLHLLDPGFKRVYNGTRKHDADLYAGLIEKGGVLVYRRKHKENGKYIWPDPGIIEKIETLKKEWDPFTVACELDNDPIGKGTREFEPGWIKTWNPSILRAEFVSNPAESDLDLLKEWYGELRIMMACDPNRSVKKGSSYMSIIVCGFDERMRMFGLDIIRDRFYPEEMVSRFIKMFKKWNPVEARVETYGGDTNFKAWVVATMKQQGLPWNKVKEFPKSPHHHKDDRIKDLQMPAQQGLIWLPEGNVWDEVRGEFLRFPFGKYKDSIDTLAYMWLYQAKPFVPKKQEQHVPYWRRGYEKTASSHGQLGWLLN